MAAPSKLIKNNDMSFKVVEETNMSFINTSELER